MSKSSNADIEARNRDIEEKHKANGRYKTKLTKHWFFRHGGNGWNTIWAETLEEAKELAESKTYSSSTKKLYTDPYDFRAITSEEYDRIIKLTCQD
jgi:hypothetical protein